MMWVHGSGSRHGLRWIENDLGRRCLRSCYLMCSEMILMACVRILTRKMICFGSSCRPNVQFSSAAWCVSLQYFAIRGPIGNLKSGQLPNPRPNSVQFWIRDRCVSELTNCRKRAVAGGSLIDAIPRLRCEKGLFG